MKFLFLPLLSQLNNKFTHFLVIFEQNLTDMKNTILSFALLLFTFFAVAQTPEQGPQAVFGELTHEGPYDRSEILLQEKLDVKSSDDKAYQIVSYHVTIAPKSGSPIRFEVNGNKFPAKLQGSLNQIVAGDEIRVESIMAMVNKDIYDFVNLKPITLVVKGFKAEGPYEPAYPLMKDSYPVTNEPVKMDSFLRATFGDFNLSVPHSKEDILKQTEVGVYSKEGLTYNVQSFKMIVAFKNDPAVMASSNSNQLTDNMKKVLTRVKSGDRILFEAIRATGEIEGKTYRANLSPIIVTVL